MEEGESSARVRAVHLSSQGRRQPGNYGPFPSGGLVMMQAQDESPVCSQGRAHRPSSDGERGGGLPPGGCEDAGLVERMQKVCAWAQGGEP